MICPYCALNNDRVLDSRPLPDGRIRRRRICMSCGNRFTTYETIGPAPRRGRKRKEEAGDIQGRI